MAQLAKWIDQQFGLAPKYPTVEGYLQSLPSADADGGDDDDEEFLDESDVQGQSFTIGYRDSSGATSTRRITVRKLHRSADGCLCLKVFCWERQASRSFRVDRITSLCRLSDPAQIAAPIEFFEKFMTDGIDSAAAAAMQILRPGLRVLLYLARCDGKVHPAEEDVIKSFVIAHAPATPWDSIREFLKSQHPDPKLARSMLKSSLADRSSAAKLLTAAKKLVEADGVLAPEEVEALDQMYSYSEARRYQEDIR